MKRSFCLILSVIAFALAAVGCSGGSKKPTVSMFDLSQRMTEANGNAENMAYASSSDKNADELLEHVSSIDPNKVESFFISYAKEGKGDASEIVVIAVKQTGDTTEAADTLRKHIEKRIALYETYDPAQAAVLRSAEVFTYEQYAVLIVSENAEAVRRAFDGFVKTEN